MNNLKDSQELEYIIALQQQLHEYNYGVPKNGRIQGMKSAQEWDMYYRYLSPKEFEKYYGGACWDYVAYQSEKLTKEKIKFHNYYLEFLDDPNHGTHTITVCELGDRYVYLESSIKPFSGVYISDSIDDVLDFVLTIMYNMNKGKFSKRHSIYRYKYMLIYGATCEKFMEQMHHNEMIRNDVLTFKDRSIGNRILKTDTESYYRVTYNGIGIYEAFRQLVPQRVWLRFLKSDHATWLPKPPEYANGYTSYFTKLGYDKFEQRTLPFMKQYLNISNIHTEVYKNTNNIIYRDMSQIIVNENSNTMCENGSKCPYYFVSETNMDGHTLIPRIPDNYLTRIGAEDNNTPRVCLSDSIYGCLTALSKNLKGKDLFVLTVYLDSSQVYHPTTKEVPDSEITGEVWCKESIKLSCIGEIHIKQAHTKPLKYTYTDSKGTTHTANLYSWNWVWINRFSDVITEGYLMNEKDTNITESTKCDKNIKYLDIKNPTAKKYILKDPYCKKHLKFVTTQNNGEIMIDVDCDKVIGRVLIRSDDRNKGFINSVMINKKYRGYGLSHRLIDDAIKKYNGYDLLVAKENKIAINLYKKHGFVMYHKMDMPDSYYMILKSHLKDMEGLKLTSFKKMKITKQLCDKLSKKYPMIKHLRINSNTNGFFFMESSEKLVATIVVETKENDEKWIQALEVESDFKGRKLGHQLLEFAVTQMGARFLSVRKTNKIAINLYKKHGFKIYNETESMYFMKLDKK